MIKLRMIGLACVIALAPGFAAAQDNGYFDDPPPGRLPSMAPQPNNSHIPSGMAARDGCVNVPGEMHNSSDCMKVNPWDFNPSASDFQTDLSGRPTGASENAARNARIAAQMQAADRSDFDRGYDRGYRAGYLDRRSDDRYDGYPR